MADLEGTDIAAAASSLLADPVLVIGGDATLVWANPAAVARFGWSVERLLGRPLDRFVHPDDHETALMSLASVADKDVGSLVEIRIRDFSGTYSWFEGRGAGWPDGPVPGTIVLALRESTDRRHWELGQGDPSVLGTVLDVMPIITMLIGPDGVIRGANRALTRNLHRSLEATIGSSFLELVVPGDRAEVQAAFARADGLSGTQRMEIALVTAAGDEVPVSLKMVDLVNDRAIRGLVVAATDISSLVEVRSQLDHRANHDDLTGLPNRTHLRDRLEAVMAQRPEHGCTLLFGDIDGLKAINDRHGHRAGDLVLAEVASRLSRVLRQGDFVARISGDEFVMIVHTADERVVGELQRRIDEALAPRIQLPDGSLIQISMSTGVAVAEPSVDADDLLAAADAAMYVAKRERERAGGRA